MPGDRTERLFSYGPLRWKSVPLSAFAMILALTPAEVQNADAYDVCDCQRMRSALASGLSAWVYAVTRQPRGAA